MTTYSQQYAAKLQEVLELKLKIQERKTVIQAEVGEDLGRTLGASLDHVLHGRYVSDGLLKEYQVLVDRAVQEAIMYGMGALMTNVGYMAMGRGRGPSPDD